LHLLAVQAQRLQVLLLSIQRALCILDGGASQVHQKAALQSSGPWILEQAHVLARKRLMGRNKLYTCSYFSKRLVDSGFDVDKLDIKY